MNVARFEPLKTFGLSEMNRPLFRLGAVSPESREMIERFRTCDRKTVDGYIHELKIGISSVGYRCDRWRPAPGFISFEHSNKCFREDVKNSLLNMCMSESGHVVSMAIIALGDIVIPETIPFLTRVMLDILPQELCSEMKPYSPDHVDYPRMDAALSLNRVLDEVNIREAFPEEAGALSKFAKMNDDEIYDLWVNYPEARMDIFKRMSRSANMLLYCRNQMRAMAK